MCNIYKMYIISFCLLLFFFFSGEHRGVGGTFFDDMDDGSMEDCFSFLATCGNAVLPSYCPIVEKHLKDEYTDHHVTWQQLRRGRCINLNSVCSLNLTFKPFDSDRCACVCFMCESKYPSILLMN